MTVFTRNVRAHPPMLHQVKMYEKGKQAFEVVVVATDLHNKYTGDLGVVIEIVEVFLQSIHSGAKICLN